MSTTASKRTAVVRGTRGGSNRLYQVFAKSPNGSRSGSKIGKTNGSGAFTKDMTSKVDIKSGSIVRVPCGLPTGDLVSRRIVVN